VMGLIVVGGLGFLTLEELMLWARRRRRTSRFRLSTHSRLVLGSTAVLIVAGWVAFTVFEWSNTLAGLSAADRLVNGLFGSVTTRTAGFNTVDYGATHESTNFFTVLWMLVGGSPGSTAGGLKTTTVALLGFVALSRLRGLPTTNVGDRTIPASTVGKATGLFVLAIGLMSLAVFAYALTDLPGPLALNPHGTFADYLFEAVSAFNTVGLSTGVTGDLSTGGRWTTILCMFAGRVGPLTLAAAMSRTPTGPAARFRYAHDDVVIG